MDPQERPPVPPAAQPPQEHDDRPIPLKMGRGLSHNAQYMILGFAAALIVAIFVVGPAVRTRLGLSGPEQKPEEAAAAPNPNEPFKVTDRQWAALKVVPVETRVFQDASETDGRIAIDDDLVTPVYSPYSGRVTKLTARAGDTVSRGDPLFTIQASELAQAQNDLITAVGNLKTAKAQLNLNTTAEKRQHELYLAHGAALKDWQQSQVDLATAQAGTNTASVALAAVHSRLRIFGKSDSDIAEIEAAPDILHLESNTVVGAPIAGTVMQRQVGLGQNIVSASSGASNPVFMIGDLTKVWLVANAREEDAPVLHIGAPVEVKVPAFGERVFQARLAYVAASVDPNTHRLPVRAAVDNPGGALKPEMMATFRIITGSDRTAPGIPDSAIVYEGDTAHVWVGNDGGKDKTLEVRPIKTGHVRDGIVEVTAGLKPGEKIVTSGAVFIDRAVNGD